MTTIPLDEPNPVGYERADDRTAALILRALLTPATWLKQDYCKVRNQQPCFCLLGAAIQALFPTIDIVNDAGRGERAAGMFIAAACPNLAPSPNASECTQIINWNDAPWRTWAEVDAVVDRVVAHYAPPVSP